VSTPPRGACPDPAGCRRVLAPGGAPVQRADVIATAGRGLSGIGQRDPASGRPRARIGPAATATATVVIAITVSLGGVAGEQDCGRRDEQRHPDPRSDGQQKRPGARGTQPAPEGQFEQDEQARRSSDDYRRQGDAGAQSGRVARHSEEVPGNFHPLSRFVRRETARALRGGGRLPRLPELPSTCRRSIAVDSIGERLDRFEPTLELLSANAGTLSRAAESLSEVVEPLSRPVERIPGRRGRAG
jgi:hypothetical protein